MAFGQPRSGKLDWARVVMFILLLAVCFGIWTAVLIQLNDKLSIMDLRGSENFVAEPRGISHSEEPAQ